MWLNLNRANEIADIRPVPEDVIEQIQKIAEETPDPIEKAMVENLILMFELYKRSNGSFKGY